MNVQSIKFRWRPAYDFEENAVVMGTRTTEPDDIRYAVLEYKITADQGREKDWEEVNWAEDEEES